LQARERRFSELIRNSFATVVILDRNGFSATPAMPPCSKKDAQTPQLKTNITHLYVV